MSLSLLDRHAVYFFEAREAGFDLREPCAAQVPDAVFVGLVGDVDRAAAGHDDTADLFGDGHDLVDADTPLVTICAGAAAFGCEETQPARDLAFRKTFLAERFGRDVDRRAAVDTQLARE